MKHGLKERHGRGSSRETAAPDERRRLTPRATMRKGPAGGKAEASIYLGE